MWTQKLSVVKRHLT